MSKDKEGFCAQCERKWHSGEIPCGLCGAELLKEEIAAMHPKRGPICEDCAVEFGS